MATIDIAKIRYVLSFDGKDAEAGMRRITNAFNNLRKVVTFVVANKIVKEGARLGKEISILSERTGLSIQRLSRLQNVFASAGTGARGFEAAILRLNKGLMGLSRGEGALAGMLAPMGISPFGKDEKQLLLDISDWAQGQLALGRSKEQVMDYLTNVMGFDPRIAVEMLKGSRHLLEEEERLLAKVGEKKHTEELRDLAKSYDELGQAWENMKANIVGFLAPVLIPLIDGIAELAHFLGENELLGAITAVSGVVLLWTSRLKVLGGLLNTLGIGKLIGTAAGATTVTGGTAATGGVAGGIGAGTVLLGGALVAVIADSIKEVYDWITSGGSDGPITKIFEFLFKDIIDAAVDGIWNMKEWAKGKWEDLKEWYYGKRSEFGTAMSFHDFGKEGIEEAAKERTYSLFNRPEPPPMLVFDEPFLEDLSDVFGKDIPSNGMSVVNHFEGSTFGSNLPETEEAINNAMGTVMTNAVSAIG